MSKRLSKRARSKKKKNAQKHPAYSKGASSITEPKKNNPKKTGKLNKKTQIPRQRLKIENDFIKIASNYPVFKELKKYLRYLGLNLDDFFDAIDLKKFLTTGYDPKGTINEILILKDKVMVKLLEERANGSVENLIRLSSATEIQKKGTTNWIKQNDFKIEDAVGNVANKPFNLRNFENVSTKLATNFKTLPDNKLYFDFSMVRFDKTTNSLFLIIPGEIKEPKAAAELAKQFGRFVRRLKETDEISFQIGKQTKKVPSTNVFFLKDNAVGIARRKDGLSNPKSGKNISLPKEDKTPVMEIINANFKDSKPETNITKNKQEFIRFIVKINPEISPQKIQDALIEIKNKILKIPHKK